MCFGLSSFRGGSVLENIISNPTGLEKQGRGWDSGRVRNLPEAAALELGPDSLCVFPKAIAKEESKVHPPASPDLLH